METSDFQQRRVAAEKFNAENRFLKRGLALIPTKFGISFTTLFLNQARTLRHATFTAPISYQSVHMDAPVRVSSRSADFQATLQLCVIMAVSVKNFKVI